MAEDLERKAALIGTKYNKPGLNPHLITRRRLHDKLNDSLKCRLSTVVAPAGYGKTTAVLEWLEMCATPAAWLSVDAYDNNPAAFWRYICSALDTISGGISKDTEYVFSSLELMKANVHLNIMIDRLSRQSTDFLLVLDDLHLVNDPSILEGLSYLVDYLPVKMHLIVISRTEPELNLARNRIKWQILQLSEEDLIFRNEEIFRFYQARGFTLENEDLKQVINYTEGWAAALVAVAMSLEHGRKGSDVITALASSNRNIGQYLKDEVIGAWKPEELAFAMKTSILETLTAALCDAVTGEGNAYRLLIHFQEGNGFLTVADEEKQEYRYHYLFKTCLYKLLTETDPAEIPILHKRAAHWFLEGGFIPEAIEHFLKGSFYQEALELIEHKVDYLINRNDFGRLLPWIGRLPMDYQNNSFKVATIYTVYYAEVGQYDLSREWLEKMRALTEEDRCASVPEWSGYSRTVCKMVEANLLLREGNLEFLPLIFTAAETNEGGYYKMPEYNDFNTADIYFYRCPVGATTNLFRHDPERYGRLIESYRGMISKNPGYAPLGIGEYLYESNRLEEAAPHLLKALEEAKDANCAGALVPIMVDLARIKRAVGDGPGAFDALEECGRLLRDGGTSHWNYLLRAFRCRLYLDSGNTGKVEEWFGASKLTIFTEISRIREFELIVFARVLLALDRPHDAQLLLHRILEFTEDNRRVHSRVEVLNLLALQAFRENHQRIAYRYMDESLGISFKEGYVRSYLDELAPMAQLIRAYIKSRVRLGDAGDRADERTAYAASLLQQMHGSLLKTLETRDTAADEAAEKLLSQLTEQEKKVLELIVNAATNMEISEKLGISIRTVKTHTGNIYGKLGLKNRAQCVKLVRETKLL